MQNAFSPPRFFRVFTVPTLFKVQAQSFLWPGKVNSTVSPCKAKNKLYNSRIQWHRTFTTPILKGRKWRQKKKKDRTTGRLLSRRESNSQRCNSISSCVKHLQHPYREDHPTAVHPGSVLARFLSMASAFLGNVPNSWHLQTGLHFTFEFYAPQVLTEGSSDSVTGCLAFQDFL